MTRGADEEGRRCDVCGDNGHVVVSAVIEQHRTWRAAEDESILRETGRDQRPLGDRKNVLVVVPGALCTRELAIFRKPERKPWSSRPQVVPKSRATCMIGAVVGFEAHVFCQPVGLSSKQRRWPKISKQFAHCAGNTSLFPLSFLRAVVLATLRNTRARAFYWPMESLRNYYNSSKA